MKMVMKVVLGSTATLFAMNVAKAADLPVKAKAVEYVRVCSLYGAGFWHIPGTDTCIKIGGYLRVDTTFNGGAHGIPAYSGDLGQRNRYFDDFAARSRLDFQVDTRTATEYGVVRTFGEAVFQFNNFGTSNPATFAIGGPPAGLNSSLLDGVGGGYTAVGYLFIQFAGFTFGKSSSAYSTPWMGYPGNNSISLFGGNDTITGVNNIQYTAQFGNGVSASIGLDDPSVYNRTSLLNLSVAGSATTAGAFAYGGTHVPDVVGNVRVDQAWGLFQISAAAHEVDASYNILGAAGTPTNLSEISGHPDTKWGGSVMAALSIKNIPTGPGDSLNVDTTYAKGDTKNVISGTLPSPSFAMFGGSSRAYQSLGIGQTSDAVYAPVGFQFGGNGLAATAANPGGTGAIKLVEAYGLRGAFNHNWDPYWSSSLFGSAAAVRYGGNSADITTAKGQWCASYIAANKLTAANTSADFSCNPDYNVYQAGVTTRWTPVKNLTFSAEVGWFHLDQKMTGTATLTPAAPKPTATYEFRNQDTAYLELRVQRNF
ncbi:MAG: porin [Acidobacteriaceae bacterium]|nr:porin [Acidobacteriaceae bacterium]